MTMSSKDKAKDAATRARSSSWLEGYKAACKCQRCGFADPVALEFHHVDPATKDADLQRMVSNRWSHLRMRAELAKCVPLCCNCHRIVHYQIRHGVPDARFFRSADPHAVTARVRKVAA